MKYFKYTIFLILVTSFIEKFCINNIASNAIVFMSILFGFSTTSFSLILFSRPARVLYAKSTPTGAFNEFYNIVRMYKKSFFFSLTSVIMLIFNGEVQFLFKLVELFLGGYSYIYNVVLNITILLPMCASIYIFSNIVELSINFAVFSMSVRDK